MSSVSAIETAIKKLSLAEQKIIASHLGERLQARDHPLVCESHDDGIPFLAPLDTSYAYGEARRPARQAGRVAD